MKVAAISGASGSRDGSIDFRCRSIGVDTAGHRYGPKKKRRQCFMAPL